MARVRMCLVTDQVILMYLVTDQVIIVTWWLTKSCDPGLRSRRDQVREKLIPPHAELL